MNTDPIEEMMRKIEDLVDHDAPMWRIEEIITTALSKAKEQGRQEVLDEIEHEQRKLLDGFAHTADCPFCLTNNNDN